MDLKKYTVLCALTPHDDHEHVVVWAVVEGHVTVWFSPQLDGDPRSFEVIAPDEDGAAKAALVAYTVGGPCTPPGNPNLN